MPTLAPWEACTEQAARKFGDRMGVDVAGARMALQAMVGSAVPERRTENGCEVWRCADDVLAVVQPITLRLPRIIDVVFGEAVAHVGPPLGHIVTGR